MAPMEPAAPDSWVEDLTPMGNGDWNYARARHLLDRAGFGGMPDDIARLARVTPKRPCVSWSTTSRSTTGT
jgi:hypothetical protein